MQQTSRCLWVGSLRQDIDEGVFLATLNRFGEVLNIQLRQAPTGPDRWALVTFAQPHSALAAMHSLNHLHLPNLTHTELKIRLWDERPQQQPPPPPPQQQQQPWRQDSGQQHAAWADAEDEGQAPASAPAPTAMRRTVGGGWVAEEEARDEEDPLVELWVGNLHSSATRLSVRRAFECFGEVSSVHLQPAPGGRGVQFAFVELPASGAEVALEELDGRMIYELTGHDMLLMVKQSKRSLKPLLKWQQRKEQRRQRDGGCASAAHASAAALQVQCEDGSTAALRGGVREVKKCFVCDGPPSRLLWLGNMASTATAGSLQALLGSYGTVMRARLFTAPGYQNPYYFAVVELGSAAEAQAVHDALQGATHVPELCDSKPLKIRYAWPRHLVRPAPAGDGAPAEEEEEPPGFAAPLANGGSHAAAAQGHASAGEESQEGPPGNSSSSSSAGRQAAAPAGPEEPLCAGCGASAFVAVLKRCSGCRSVHYCGPACQLKHWEVQHQHDCCRLAQLERLLTRQQPAGQSVPASVATLLLAALRQPGGRQARLVQAALQQQADSSSNSQAASAAL